MTTDIVDLLVAQSNLDYDDEVAAAADQLLIGCGRCYGLAAGPGLTSDEGIHPEAVMAHHAWHGLGPESERRVIGNDGVERTREAMLADVARLAGQGSAWATISVNTTYLMSVLTSSKPRTPDEGRAIQFDLFAVDKLVREVAAELEIDPARPDSWRWKSARLAWEVTLRLLDQRPSPYFTKATADETWERAIAASVADATLNRPKGRRRVEPKLWSLFHPAQPDSEPPRIQECQVPSKSLVVSVSLTGPTTASMTEEESLTVERGPGRHDGKPTLFYSEFVRALREAAQQRDAYALRVVSRLDGQAWWHEPRSKRSKRPPSREKLLKKRAKQLVTLDRRGRTLLFALELDHECGAIEDEMGAAQTLLGRLDAQINDEVWSDQRNEYVPAPGAELSPFAVRHNLDSCNMNALGEFMYPALWWTYVGGQSRTAGFARQYAHRVWFTTLVRDICTLVGPLLTTPPSPQQVRDRFGMLIEELQINPFDTSDGAHFVQSWLVTRALWQLSVGLVEECGPYLSKADADTTWVDMMAALYKCKGVAWHELPKGTRKTVPLRLAFETHRSVTGQRDIVDAAARRGDEYAIRVKQRESTIELFVPPKKQR